MFESQAKMSRQPRPHGRFYPVDNVDNVWKADTKAMLERRDLSQAELARRIGASPGSCRFSERGY